MEGKKNQRDQRDQRQVKSKRETNRRNMKIGCRCNTNSETKEKEGNETGRRENKKIMMIRKLKEKKGGSDKQETKKQNRIEKRYKKESKEK